MGVVYLVLSHTLPEQVARLVNRLRADSPGGAVAIHHDPTGAPLAAAALRDGGVRLVPDPRPVGWAGFSFAAAQLRAVTWCRRVLDADWVVVLSGQDYPVRPLAELEALLATTPYDAFAEVIPVPPPRGAAGRWLGRGVDEFNSRYYFRYFGIRAPRPLRAPLRRLWGARLVRELPSGELRIGLPAPRLPFDEHLSCHRGANWSILSGRAVDGIARIAADHPQLLRHYRRTFAPDESLTATLLAADASLAVNGDYMRYTSWESPRASHPAVLGTHDLPLITGSGAFFARKFDARVDPAVLDALDRRLEGGPAAAATP